MEFRLAAEGNTDELRQWLRSHAERVNVPAAGSNMTLLYTAISNANRTDLASLQAGHSRYLNTVRMLCEEYKADVLAPNGGSYNTSLHIAASIGATDIVRYLVEVLRTPVDRTNVFGERPVQIAERGGHADCVAILQQASNAGGNTNVTSEPSMAEQTEPSHSSAGTGNAFSRFQSVTVSDSDDDDNSEQTRPHHGGNRGSHNSLGRQNSSNFASAKPFFSGAAANSSQHGFTSGVPNQPPPLPPSLGMLGSPPAGETRRSYTKESSSNSFGSAPKPHGWRPPPPPPPPPLPPQQSTDASSVLLAEASLPQPVRPRKEYDISKSRILANPDLQGFRSAYGDGFKYIQCSDHYEIRGILPYTYRGTVYYTPVIISVYAPNSLSASGAYGAAGGDACETPTSTNPAESHDAVSTSSCPTSPLQLGDGGAQTLSQTSCADASSGTRAPTHATAADVYCRYRVCLNMQSLNDFAVSRKAEYIDPISGAIIPAPGDDKYQTLTAYIRNVVVRNFEAVPPLIVPTSTYAFPLRPNISQLGAAGSADVYRHHHSHNAPVFMKNALATRTSAHVRCAAIWRDLSKFGDGLGRYFPANHRVVVYVPVFSEHKAAVLAMPQERSYTTTVDINAVPATPNGGVPDASRSASSKAAMASGDGFQSVDKKGVSQQMVVEAVAELQLRVALQFSPITGAGSAVADPSVDGLEGGVYAYPPRVFLLDAALSSAFNNAGGKGNRGDGSSSASLTAACFADILRDRNTGEVQPDRLSLSQESWSAKGSLYDILVELQQLLRDTLETFAIRYTGRHPASSPAQQQGNAAATAYGSGGPGAAASSPSQTSPRQPAAASPLDNFFASPTAPQARSTAAAPGSSATASSAGHCLYCYQALQTRSLLQPCGHDGACGLCVQRLQSHAREEVFTCPVCRAPVRSVMEVFL